MIGGSSGVGLEVARRARNQGAKLILTDRNVERLQRAASEVSALSTSTFDATDPTLLDGRLVDIDVAQEVRALTEHPMLFINVARSAALKMRPGGTLIFMGSAGSRRPAVNCGHRTPCARSQPLALELAPARANLIAAGFIDSPFVGVRPRR